VKVNLYKINFRLNVPERVKTNVDSANQYCYGKQYAWW